MSTPLPVYFTPHTVFVRDRIEGGMGPTFGEPREVAAFVLDETELVRARDGSEVVSSTKVHVNVDEDIAPGAHVRVWVGTTAEREATVLSVARMQHPTLPSLQTLALE